MDNYEKFNVGRAELDTFKRTKGVSEGVMGLG